MTEERRCASCGSPLPEEARFCIECGRPVAEAVTGATQRIPEPEDTRRCPSCDTLNPALARFCVNCGRSFEVATATAEPPRPAAAPTYEPIAPVPPLPPTPPALAAPRPVSQRKSTLWGGLGGGAFLIGLGVLAITGWWWPGIMVVLGISALLGSTAAGQPWAGVQGAFWMFGIALLAITGWWWPGILILVGLSFIFGAAWRPSRRAR